jgi:hypothetical protein
MSTRASHLMRLASVLIVASSIATGCAKRRDEDRVVTIAADAGAPVDLQLMAYLSEARALHHAANLREDSNDAAGAILAMKHLVAMRVPHPERRAPEVDEVLADAYARLAELEAHTKDMSAATAAIESGLAHAPNATYFRGHLLEVDGVIEETRGAMLADAGDEAGAAKARAHAIQLLQQAVKLQGEVVAGALNVDAAVGGGSK